MHDAYAQAKSIVAKLVKAGHTAYFAGGWVRDHVMGYPSEDIDIATSASAAQIMDLFPKTLLVGLSFGVVIVVMGRHQFEVASFRKDLPYHDGRHPEGIELASSWEDAQRRDFTINGMFYDPLEEVLHDYVHGREDIRLAIIRTIGDPHERFFEDRLRMLRAFRFAARFGFAIEPETQAAIREHAHKLFPAVAWERVWQEFNKMAAYPRFGEALVEMHRLGILAIIFPEIAPVHLKELRHQTERFAHFPPATPAILYITAILGFLSLEQRLDVAKRLKVSNKEIKWLSLMCAMEQALQDERRSQNIDLPLWAALFAHDDWAICLRVGLTAYDSAERQQLEQTYAHRFAQLQPHVERLRHRQPIVSASLLQQRGIKPGKEMGILLKEAERIAIEQDWHAPQPILAQLAASPLWPAR